MGRAEIDPNLLGLEGAFAPTQARYTWGDAGIGPSRDLSGRRRGSGRRGGKKQPQQGNSVSSAAQKVHRLACAWA